MEEKSESSNILKSTSIVGGGQILNIFIGFVRTKVVAIILGPAGVGIVGLLQSAIDLIRNLASLGLPFSGVRDITLAHSKNDSLEVSRVVKIFNQWILYCSVAGLVLTIVFSDRISVFLFNDHAHRGQIMVVSICVFFAVLTSGFSAILQGNRAIGLMAKSSVLSSLISTCISLPVYYFLREKGIVPVLILTGMISLLVTFFNYKKLAIPAYTAIKFSASWHSAKGMIRLGIFTIIVSVFDQMMSLYLRSFISGKAGIDAVGIYTAAYSLGTLYLSVVLSSMSADYFPRLSSIQNDNIQINKTVNNQLQITLLLALPIMVGMLSFMDIVVSLLYSAKFSGAVNILKWHILGDFFKLISWPFGFVFLAKNLGKLYLASSIAYTTCFTFLSIAFWHIFQLEGLGFSFFVTQLILMSFNFIYCKVKFRLSLSRQNLLLLAYGGVILLLAYSADEYFKDLIKYILGGVVTAISIGVSIFYINKIINLKAVLNKFIAKKK